MIEHSLPPGFCLFLHPRPVGDAEKTKTTEGGKI